MKLLAIYGGAKLIPIIGLVLFGAIVIAIIVERTRTKNDTFEDRDN
jgi:hypothetical protein